MEKRNKFDLLFISILGIVLFFNLAGLVIEGLFRFGVLETDIANIRKLSIISGLFSIGIIVSGTLFILNLFKSRKRSILYWHIFMGVAFVMGIYKFFKPSYLSVLVPYYNYIFLGIVLLIWGLISYYLGKKILK
jgi:hypothetical protein